MGHRQQFGGLMPLIWIYCVGGPLALAFMVLFGALGVPGYGN